MQQGIDWLSCTSGFWGEQLCTKSGISHHKEGIILKSRKALTGISSSGDSSSVLECERFSPGGHGTISLAVADLASVNWGFVLGAPDVTLLFVSLFARFLPGFGHPLGGHRCMHFGSFLIAGCVDVSAFKLFNEEGGRTRS